MLNYSKFILNHARSHYLFSYMSLIYTYIYALIYLLRWNFVCQDFWHTYNSANLNAQQKELLIKNSKFYSFINEQLSKSENKLKKKTHVKSWMTILVKAHSCGNTNANWKLNACRIYLSHMYILSINTTKIRWQRCQLAYSCRSSVKPV